MTRLSLRLSDAVVELYRAGLSRQEIYEILDTRVSERRIRQEIKDAKAADPFSEYEHEEAKKSLRRRSRGIAHNPKDFGQVYRNKALGRGYHRLEDIGLIRRDTAEEYWKSYRSIEGS